MNTEKTPNVFRAYIAKYEDNTKNMDNNKGIRVSKYITTIRERCKYNVCNL